MLRIVLALEGPEEVVLKIAGWLGGDHVEVLAAEGRRYRGRNQKLTLDLNEVRGIDSGGIALLRTWVQEGVEVRGGSQFIRLFLEKNNVL